MHTVRVEFCTGEVEEREFPDRASAMGFMREYAASYPDEDIHWSRPTWLLWRHPGCEWNSYRLHSTDDGLGT